MADNQISERLVFSVILAFRNEEQFLEGYLKLLDDQTFPKEKWEIILVDGCSGDASRAIAQEYVSKHDNAKLVDNPKKIVTAGWNRGLDAAVGKYYHIANGHSLNDPDLFLRADEILKKNEQIHALGGRIFKIGLSKESKAVSMAMNTPLAMGGSYYRIGTKEKRVNVIGQGFYLRELTERIGRYDETLGRSGDWEFNYRICKNGYNMFFNPKLVIKVFSRAGYRSSFVQMFRTGFWKVKIWAMHPKSVLPRHLIPPFFVSWLLTIPPVMFLAGINYGLIYGSPIILYILVIIFNIWSMPREGISRVLIGLTYPVIHTAYGAGFIAGIMRWGKLFFRGSRDDNREKQQ